MCVGSRALLERQNTNTAWGDLNWQKGREDVAIEQGNHSTLDVREDGEEWIRDMEGRRERLGAREREGTERKKESGKGKGREGKG